MHRKQKSWWKKFDNSISYDFFTNCCWALDDGDDESSFVLMDWYCYVHRMFVAFASYPSFDDSKKQNNNFFLFFTDKKKGTTCLQQNNHSSSLIR